MQKKEVMQRVPRRVRGSLLVRADDSMEFTPFMEGESTQDVLAQKGRSKLYRTKGKKQPQMVVYATVDADSADPRARLLRTADELTRCLADDNGGEAAAQSAVKVERECILHGRNVDVYVNETAGRIGVETRIDMRRGTDYVATLVESMQRVSQSVMENRERIRANEK